MNLLTVYQIQYKTNILQFIYLKKIPNSAFYIYIPNDYIVWTKTLKKLYKI